MKLSRKIISVVTIFFLAAGILFCCCSQAWVLTRHTPSCCQKDNPASRDILSNASQNHHCLCQKGNYALPSAFESKNLHLLFFKYPVYAQESEIHGLSFNLPIGLSGFGELSSARLLSIPLYLKNSVLRI